MAERRTDEPSAAPSAASATGAPASSSEVRRPSGSERFSAALDATGARSMRERTRPPAAKRVRRARLRLTHIDPWSVMKTAFLLSVALGIVIVVSVAIVWSVLGAAGVWDSINATVGDVVGDSGNDFRVEDYLGMSRVMGFTLIVAVVDVVLATVIATLAAFLYNLAAALLGGVEVVLAEDDR